MATKGKAKTKPTVSKDPRKRVSKSILRRFAAEIKRCTNFPLGDDMVELAIKNFEREEAL